MSNLQATARSNYFLVKDNQAFINCVDAIPGLRIILRLPDVLVELGEAPGQTHFGVVGDDGWPTVWKDAEKTKETEMCEIIAPHLQDGQVCVLMESGHEKSRYVFGHAQAFDNTGKVERIALGDIHELAVKTFGVIPTEAYS